MKKNININLFGTLYAIDEDACTLLENYLDNMRSYFAKRDGGDEIFDDIEHRVAEHLWSLKESGMTAIDIDTVKQIISSIGNPDEMESGVEEVADSKIEETSDAEADSEDKEQAKEKTKAKEKAKLKAKAIQILPTIPTAIQQPKKLLAENGSTVCCIT